MTHFHQQVVGDGSANWSRLNQSLYAVTFVTQGERDKCRCCILCLESDHAEVCSVLTICQFASSSRRVRGDQESRDSSSATAAREPVAWPASHGIKGIATSQFENTAMYVFAVLMTTRSLVALGYKMSTTASLEG